LHFYHFLYDTTLQYSQLCLHSFCRLFSCGTSKDGDSHLVEWNETEGAIKRTYSGFRRRSLGVVQFDTTRNRFLAAGDEFMIKFWDMDNTNMMTTADAEGGLPVSRIMFSPICFMHHIKEKHTNTSPLLQASPRLRFNKEGSLLAVTTSDNGLKILANTDGQRLLRLMESRSFEGSRGSSQQANTKVRHHYYLSFHRVLPL